jgi:hypothetical protein
MWDAVLASVPSQPTVPAAGAARSLTAREQSDWAGDYRFSADVTVRVSAKGGRLYARALGRHAYAIPLEAPVALQPVSATAFTVPSRYPVVLEFGTAGSLVINPGSWAQTGLRGSTGRAP